jgi:hypothetical protein
MSSGYTTSFKEAMVRKVSAEERVTAVNLMYRAGSTIANGEDLEGLLPPSRKTVREKGFHLTRDRRTILVAVFCN